MLVLLIKMLKGKTKTSSSSKRVKRSFLPDFSTLLLVADDDYWVSGRFLMLNERLGAVSNKQLASFI